jgi:hypothetical protein
MRLDFAGFFARRTWKNLPIPDSGFATVSAAPHALARCAPVGKRRMRTRHSQPPGHQDDDTLSKRCACTHQWRLTLFQMSAACTTLRRSAKSSGSAAPGCHPSIHSRAARLPGKWSASGSATWL